MVMNSSQLEKLESDADVASSLKSKPFRANDQDGQPCVITEALASNLIGIKQP